MSSLIVQPVVRVEHHERVAVLRMCLEDNVLRTPLLDALHAALNEVEMERLLDDPPSPVVIVGDGDSFCTGVDVDWMWMADDAERVLPSLHRLFARLLTYPAITVAAINGHALAEGALLALACDERIMSDNLGVFSFPQVDIGLRFTPAMLALISTKLTAATARAATLTAHRYSAGEALAAGLIDEISPPSKLLDRAVERATARAGRNSAVFAATKAGLYKPVLDQLSTLPDEQ